MSFKQMTLDQMSFEQLSGDHAYYAYSHDNNFWYYARQKFSGRTGVKTKKKNNTTSVISHFTKLHIYVLTTYSEDEYEFSRTMVIS